MGKYSEAMMDAIKDLLHRVNDAVGEYDDYITISINDAENIISLLESIIKDGD